jgi:hypothetical protein
MSIYKGVIGRVAQPHPGPTGAAFAMFGCLHVLQGQALLIQDSLHGQAELLDFAMEPDFLIQA